MSVKSNSISFGSLGSVEIEAWEKPDVEVFAKYENSVNGNSGAPYNDDCHLSGGTCSHVTFIE